MEIRTYIGACVGNEGRLRMRTTVAFSHEDVQGVSWMAVATILSSFLVLGGAVALKAFILSEAEEFAIGNSTRTGDALQTLTKRTPRNGLSQDRIQRALRRP